MTQQVRKALYPGILGAKGFPLLFSLLYMALPAKPGSDASNRESDSSEVLYLQRNSLEAELRSQIGLLSFFITKDGIADLLALKN